MYCKYCFWQGHHSSTPVLIVAKCNVNSRIRTTPNLCFTVLIVAKCNVNTIDKLIDENAIARVLIVAKCNVNVYEEWLNEAYLLVLIVAKCNVNTGATYDRDILGLWY